MIARVVGGLGNQLFIYAAARALALDRGARAVLDVSYYRFYLDRHYAIGDLVAAETLVDPVVVRDWRNSPWIDRALIAWRHRAQLIRQRGYAFGDEFAGVRRRRLYLDGYWQSPRYFDHHAELLRNELRPPAPVEEVVGLHVRRGDYVTDPGAAAVMGFVGADYYRRAVERLRAELGDGFELRVFSDDPQWCSSELQVDHPFTVVEPGPAAHDLLAMSNCRHLVTANSSFSWWAAWLRPDPGITIAPANWFSGGLPTHDLLPASWQQI